MSRRFRNRFPSRILERITALGSISSLVSGCDWRADTASTIEIDAGEIFISDPTNETFKYVKITAKSGVTHSGTAISRIDIDSNGNVTVPAFLGQMSEATKVAGNVQIGIVSHFDGVNIDEEFTTISAVIGMSIPGNQDMFATGDRRIRGLDIVLNANLTFGMDLGSYINPFAQEFHVTPAEAFLINLPALATIGSSSNSSLALSWFGNTAQVGSLSGFTTLLDPDSWDDPDIAPGSGSPDGTLTGLESQNIFISAANGKAGLRVIAQYGRIRYAKIEDAVAGAASEFGSRKHATNLDGGFALGMVSLKQGATDMTDTAQAVAHPPASILTTVRA